MVAQPAWGGWVPWPAMSVSGLQNPQTTGQDGAFTFVTPPDSYYLQVENAAAYQPWRSPVLTDVTTIQVPLTPLSSGTVKEVSHYVGGAAASSG